VYALDGLGDDISNAITYVTSNPSCTATSADDLTCPMCAVQYMQQGLCLPGRYCLTNSNLLYSMTVACVTYDPDSCLLHCFFLDAELSLRPLPCECISHPAASNKTLLCFRYLIQYSVSDSSGVAATPLTISITFVEVALVTGSFLFIGQADTAAQAQQHATQLYTSGTAPNTALTTDVAAVYQTWLTSNVTGYVEQMTAALGASTAVVAAINTLELSLFSSVRVSDVTVLNATIDQSITSILNVNSSHTVQNYCYNVTLQVTVLTADMLLSVFVNVLNSTASRRHLMSSSDFLSTTISSNMLPLPAHVPAIPDLAAVSSHLSGSMLAEPFENATISKHLPYDMIAEPFQHEQDLAGSIAASILSCSTAQQGPQTGGCDTQQTAQLLSTRNLATPSSVRPTTIDSMLHLHQMMLQAQVHTRRLQSTTSASTFPLVSLLTFKVDLMLAAFGGTSGCSTASVAALFYEDEETPESLDDLCGTDGGTDLSMNQALLASANSTVPLLQVGYAVAMHFSLMSCPDKRCNRGLRLLLLRPSLFDLTEVPALKLHVAHSWHVLTVTLLQA